jgi:hypothetical protein
MDATYATLENFFKTQVLPASTVSQTLQLDEESQNIPI